MAEISYPFVDGPTTDAQFSAMFRMMFPPSVYAMFGSTALQVIGDSSGLQVKGQPGEGFVRGHYYKCDAVKTMAIAANATGSPRIDTAILKLEYAAVKSVTMQIKTGAAPSTAPPLTQTEAGVYEFPLADIAVPAGASTIAAGQVTDRRVFWGREFLRLAGLVSGPTQPDLGTFFYWLKTPS